MELPSKIQFADEKTRIAFGELEFSDNRLYNCLKRTLKEIEKNSFSGIQIPKRLIPKEYSRKYNIRNLWKYNLPNAWRLLYSIESDGIVVVSIVLEWLGHKEYERIFNY